MLVLSEKFKLNGVPLYEPSKCLVQTVPVKSDDCGYDALGNLHVKVTGYRRIITLTWDIGLGSEIKHINEQLITSSSVHTLQYVDALRGLCEIEVTYDTCDTNTLDRRISNDEEGGIVQGFSVAFIGTKKTLF